MMDKWIYVDGYVFYSVASLCLIPVNKRDLRLT